MTKRVKMTSAARVAREACYRARAAARAAARCAEYSPATVPHAVRAAEAAADAALMVEVDPDGAGPWAHEARLAYARAWDTTPDGPPGLDLAAACQRGHAAPGGTADRAWYNAEQAIAMASRWSRGDGPVPPEARRALERAEHFARQAGQWAASPPVRAALEAKMDKACKAVGVSS